MKKYTTLSTGILMLGIELAVFIFWLIVNSSFATKVLSMITANHIGGRLAFIAVGLENDLSLCILMPIIIFYNTTYLLLMYSAFVLLSGKIKKFKLIGGYIESERNKAKKRKLFFKQWNRFGISFFIWVPLPWTGAVIGSYIAHLEGYNTKDTLLTVLPSMWVGIISWTLWFDELYEFIEQFGKGKTMFLTMFLLIVPILIYGFGNVVRSDKSRPKK
ncbi:MAG: small multi-drug export protein [Candidatus Aminicenantes bacterium]|nr:small multi-drug export protein [Candidatus Aminicenantes bacterium]